MENNKSQLNLWRTIALISLACLLVVSGLYINTINKNKEVEPKQDEPVISEDWLTLWNDDARAKQELTSYIEAITDENNPDYIPVERRIAVFDLDGTLFCETDPVYFDHMIYNYRVLEDPDYKDKATPYQLEVAAKVQQFIDTGEYPEGLDNEHGIGVATAFAGMTLKQFNDYVNEFKKTPTNGYNNMNKGDAFYLPMIEVIDYLQDNDFTVYIVSGTDRLIVRGIVDGISFLNIPNNQIIGSDELLVTRKQGDTDGLDYVYTNDDELVLAGEFIVKNIKMNKVSVIAQEIGMQPVLSFDNSTGDSSMAEYVISNNQYRSLAFMLCCDDTVRENGNEAKAQKMYDLCNEFGWIPVSMKNDWKTIYGDEVTRK